MAFMDLWRVHDGGSLDVFKCFRQKKHQPRGGDAEQVALIKSLSTETVNENQEGQRQEDRLKLADCGSRCRADGQQVEDHLGT